MYRFLFLSIIILGCSSKQLENNSANAIINTYFKMQKALTEDKTEQTAAYIAEMKKNLDELKLTDEKVMQRISASLESYSGINDLKTQRDLFQELSNSVALLVNRVGYTNDIFVMHCPMAFEGKGGTWLQASADLINPYYGSEMLKCGDQVTVIAARN